MSYRMRGDQASSDIPNSEDQTSSSMLSCGDQATSAAESSDKPMEVDGEEYDVVENQQTAAESDAARGDQARAARSPKVRLKSKLHSFRCRICSYKRIIGYKTKKVKHNHFCSKYFRKCCVPSDKKDSVHYCPTCKKFHGLCPNERLKICIASSNLHKFWNPSDPYFKYEGDSSHVDYITIPGARINQLTVAWEIQYGKETRGMDIFFAGGLFNIKSGYGSQSIMRALKHFVELVNWQADTFHPGIKNTCTIAPLPYPPKFCWMGSNRPPPDNFVNKVDVIKEINTKIEVMNRESGMKAPNFTTFGLRKLKRGRKEITKHRLEHWRLEGEDEKLTLMDDIRVKMGRQVVKFFEYWT